MLESRIHAEETSFAVAHSRLTSELESLKRQLEDTAQSNGRELEDMQYELDHAYYTAQETEEQRIRQLNSQLTALQAPVTSASTYQQSQLEQANAQLQTEAERLRGEKQMLQEKVARLSLQPEALDHAHLFNSEELNHYSDKFGREREEMERQRAALDALLTDLRLEINDVSVQLRRVDEDNYLTVRDLRRKVDDAANDIDYYRINNRFLSHENREASTENIGFSEHSAQVEAELGRLREMQEQLRPQAKQLESLVYGRGMSPKRTTSKKKLKVAKSKA